MARILIAHDIRRWCGPSVWSTTQLARTVHRLRGADGGAPKTRTWGFGWHLDDPFSWRLMYVSRYVAAGNKKFSRGRNKHMVMSDFGPALVAPQNAWCEWLGIADPAVPPTNGMPPEIDPWPSGPTQPQAVDPGSIQGHPGAFVPAQSLGALAELIAERYLAMSGLKFSNQQAWSKFLPQILPGDEFFRVFSWKLMAKRASLTT